MQLAAEILCIPLVIKLISELQKLLGSFQAGVSRHRAEEGTLHQLTAQCRGAEVPGQWFGGLHPHALPVGTPQPRPERAEDMEMQITGKFPVSAALQPPRPLVCVPSLTARSCSFPYVRQSINIFLPIFESAPGEESHYLNINSLCGLSCNKAGVRRC